MRLIIPHELSEMDKKNRFEISAAFLLRHKRKSFLHKIDDDDEKSWQIKKSMTNKMTILNEINFRKPPTSMAKPNLHFKKVLLSM